MTTIRRSLRLLAATACMVIVLVGCSDSTAGTPTPATSGAATSTANANVFANLDSCEVINQLLGPQGFDPGYKTNKRNECQATKFAYSTFALSLDPVQGLAEFKATYPAAVTIDVNGRNAMQAIATLGNVCSVAIEVSTHARAVTNAAMSNPSQDSQACPNAKQLAEQVEPLLPKVQ